MADSYAQRVLVQEFVSGYEVEVPIIISGRPKALGPVGISLDGSRLLGSRILTYALSGGDRYGFWLLREEINPTGVKNLLRLAEKCAELLWLRDLCRIDFRIDKEGNPKVIDLSTSPYLCPHSSFAFLAKAAGQDASVLPLVLVGIAAARLGLK